MARRAARGAHLIMDVQATLSRESVKPLAWASIPSKMIEGLEAVVFSKADFNGPLLLNQLIKVSRVVKASKYSSIEWSEFGR